MSEPIDYADVWDDEVDAIIEEIWEVRRKMWQRFNNDPVKMGAYFMERQRRGGGQGFTACDGAHDRESASGAFRPAVYDVIVR